MSETKEEFKPMSNISTSTSPSKNYSNPKSSLTHTLTQEERQLLHPLELNDKLAFESIKTVRLDFLTEEAKAPIPRCQDLPSHAFSRLNGRSILVSISHGWFFQAHPDPYGTKLELIKNVFAPQLRERYPHTDIQVYFYYLSVPQNPRSDDDDEDIYLDVMERMNSVFLYADVVLILDVENPKVDMTFRLGMLILITHLLNPSSPQHHYDESSTSLLRYTSKLLSLIPI